MELGPKLQTGAATGKGAKGVNDMIERVIAIGWGVISEKAHDGKIFLDDVGSYGYCVAGEYPQSITEEIAGRIDQDARIIDDLAAAVGRLDAKNGLLVKDRNAALAGLTRAEKELAGYRAPDNIMKVQNDSLAEKLRDSQAALGATQEERADLSRIIDALEKEVAGLRTQIRTAPTVFSAADIIELSKASIRPADLGQLRRDGVI